MSFSERNGKRIQINKYFRVLHVNKSLSKYSIRPAQNCVFQKKRTSFHFFNASLTLETAIVLPLFLCAILTILSIALVFLTEIKVQDALMQTAEELSWSVSVFTDDSAKQKDSLKKYASARMLLCLKDSVVSHPVISNGALGIDYSKSTYLEQKEEIHLVAEFDAVLPIALFGKRTYGIRQEAVTRAWVGNRTNEEYSSDTQYVYITKYGTVYHLTKDCRYLTREIQSVRSTDLVSIRNAKGGIYKSCQQCAKDILVEKQIILYITLYGERYHTDKNCSTLKRYIQKIKKENVGNKNCCSVCGGE